MPSVERAEVVVIGMGPGGEDLVGRLAEEGLDVVGVEKELVGGECPYWGCVPSKMMIRAGDLLAEGRRIPGMAGASTITADWSPVAKRIREEATDSWNDEAAADRFESKGGRLIRGTGKLLGPRRVGVGDTEIQVSRAIVLNAGSKPTIPDVEGIGTFKYWTNREAIETDEVPESLLVLGGGAIGLELAQLFSRFGSKVTVVEAGERILAAEEPESSELLTGVLRSEGLDIRTGVGAKQFRKDGDAIVLTLADGNNVAAQRCLVATGRHADLKALGVASVGIDENQKFIPVDERMRAAPGVWAIGDLTGKGMFTHISMYQSGIAICDILGRDGATADYAAVPRVTFTDPEVGSVGMTETAAREAGRNVRTGTAPLQESARGWIHKVGNEGLIKLIEDTDTGLLAGATSIGPSGGEVLSLLTLAVHARVPIDDLSTMIYAYPTFHRAIEAAVAQLRPQCPTALRLALHR